VPTLLEPLDYTHHRPMHRERVLGVATVSVLTWSNTLTVSTRVAVQARCMREEGGPAVVELEHRIDA
jgi:hypothetical protein